MIYCPRCGKENDVIARFCQSCGATLPTDARIFKGYAGFWKRFAAFIIDFIVVSVGVGIISIVTFGTGTVPSVFLLHWVYEALMTSSEKQATVGKIMLDIVVTDTTGGRITFLRATGRYFAKFISGFILFIGFIMAGFTEKKQALHDMIADTLVVDR